MKYLCINAGSSSLKYQLFEMPEEKVVISGIFEKIGLKDSFWTTKINGEKIKGEKYLKDHSDAVEEFYMVEKNILIQFLLLMKLLMILKL